MMQKYSSGEKFHLDGPIRRFATEVFFYCTRVYLLEFHAFRLLAGKSPTHGIFIARMELRVPESAPKPWLEDICAFTVVVAIATSSPTPPAAATELEERGFRVLAVAAGPTAAMQLIGLIALSDPARAESGELVTKLKTLGVREVMVMGDAPATAAIVAHTVGLNGPVCPPGPIPNDVRPESFSVFAGVLPEDKFKLGKTFQQAGHIVGMCGDVANDAPALRQAQMGIAFWTATDVAKSAAGIVLTTPGLIGVAAAGL
jgi:H+-transporting ATPase